MTCGPTSVDPGVNGVSVRAPCVGCGVVANLDTDVEKQSSRHMNMIPG